MGCNFCQKVFTNNSSLILRTTLLYGDSWYQFIRYIFIHYSLFIVPYIDRV